MGEALRIATEPADSLYFDLLALAVERCATFSLTWRDQLTYRPSASDLDIALRPFLIREARTNRWPGTVLTDSLATVRHYRLTRDSVPVLRGPASLYAWRAPELPEDLAFYAADGSVWLTTISHEAEAWFENAAQVDSELRRRLPGLVFAKGGQ
jgi:hypothetical protein